MRSIIIGFVVFIAACNGSDTTVVHKTVTKDIPYSDPALVAQVASLTKALSDATHVQAEQSVQLAKLQLVGKLKGVSTHSFRETESIAPNFGPCQDMGVLLGRGVNSNSTDPLSSPLESFQQCTGYDYSVVVQTNMIAVSPRIFFDGPNCTGNILEWEAGGGGYNTQTLQNGVVFLSPIDGSPLMVKSGQTPKLIMFQSVWVTSNPGCQSDIETQLMYEVTPNDTSITGIPNNGVGSFQLLSP